MKTLFTAILIIGTLCQAEDRELDLWKTPEPMTYESLRDWHARGGLSRYHWPKEHKVDLNHDGKDEVFLGVMGFGRGMVYALFTEKEGKWMRISGEIEGSHHSFEVIPAKENVWRDFRSLQPNGRGGFIETLYSWSGQQYDTKSSREITAKDPESREMASKSGPGGDGPPPTHSKSD